MCFCLNLEGSHEFGGVGFVFIFFIMLAQH